MIGKEILNCINTAKLTLVFLIFHSASHQICSQKIDLPFENFSVDEGMPTQVNCILQDRTGYLWFAANSGLYKYDGYNFDSYKHDLDDTTSLIDNTLTTLYEDKAGVLWIGSYIGLEKFDPMTGTFKHYTPNPHSIGKDPGNNVWAICEDKYSTLWVGTGDGLYKFDRAIEQFTSLRYDSTDPGSLSGNEFGSIYQDKKGSLWFGTQAGLDRFDFKTGKFIHFWNDTSNRSQSRASKHRINTIFEDEMGILWLGTNKGLVEFNSKTGTFSNYLFNPLDQTNRITSICQDVLSGNLWLASWGGFFSFDKKSKKFTHYNSEANFVLGERSGTLWIGTNTYIKKINRIKQPFKKYPTNNIICLIVVAGKRTLWVWTLSAEWLKFDIDKEQFIPYSYGKGNKPYFMYSENEMIIQNEKGGCYRLDTLGNKKPFLPDSLKDFNNSLSWGCKTKDGYWLGSHSGGFYLLNPDISRIKEIRNLKFSINNIVEDKFGLIWICTVRGKIFCYNPAIDSLKEFLSGRVINDIWEDKKGRLWFATNTALIRYERSANSFTHFTKKNGLPSDDIRGIVEDDHGYWWIITPKGISKFDMETKKFKNYDNSYGLDLTSDVLYGGGCKTSDGEIFIPGVNGFTRFHPDSIKDNPFIPPIVITSFKKFDKSYPFSKEIYLPHNENFLSFEFAALSFISPERNQYAYMMEGLDKDWVYSGTRRYASYPNLDPGEYVFRVKGSNNDGVWNEAGTSILIIISPPWWKTTWAYILYSILILTIIYYTWKMQVKSIKISHEYEMSRFEAEKLHEVDEMKSRFFANISHEFRTPLTLILGPVKQMIEQSKDDNNRNELRVVHRNANRMLGLVNQLLDISKLESGSMKLQTAPQNIIPLLKALLQSFCSYAERKRITLKFNSTCLPAGKAEDEIIVYIDKDKIEKIITNILSNAFKFTPEGGCITVSVRESFTKLEIPKSPLSGIPFKAGQVRDDFRSVRNDQYQFVEIKIADSGIGIPKEKLPKIFDRFYQVDSSHTGEQVAHPAIGGEGTGIGLSLTKELVELHKGKIEVESEEGKGTTFIISLPLGKEHLKPEEIYESSLSQIPTSRDFSEEIIFPEETKTTQSNISLITETGKPFLLIVEDNSDVRYYIKNNLKKDYRILEAVDGEDGWNKSIEQIPDLIVSDVMMPKMDGFKLCDKLKTDERTSHIPVILLTAKASGMDKIVGFKTGTDDYIMKPFEPGELKARIENLIEQRKRIHEHFRKHGLFEIEEKNITPVDQKFLQKVFAIINEHISDTSFGVEMLSSNMAVSRSVLLRKIESLIGEPPIELIKRTRLSKAAKLIESKFGNISEIALEVGFNNPSYFAECFKKQYGISPSQYHHKYKNS